MDGRPLLGLCLLAVGQLCAGCLPADDLKEYSAGAKAPPESTSPLRGSPSPSSPSPSSPSPSSPGPSEPNGPSGEAVSDGAVTSAPPNDSEAPPDPRLEPGGEGSQDLSPGGVDGAGADDPTASSSDDPAPTPEATQFRFVRLVADSAVQGGPYTSIAEFNVLDAAGAPLDRSEWVARADSEETVYVGGAGAHYAIDGEADSMWHTAWFDVNPAPRHPHTLEIDMGAPHAVSGFRYLARQDGSLDGRVAAFRFFVSVDGVAWGEPVAAGSLANSTDEQDVELP